MKKLIDNHTKIAYIYALIDPRYGIVRYVGKTVTPKTRKYQHVTDRLVCNTYKSKWINSLHKLNLRPIFKILEICPYFMFESRESHYISIYKSSSLTNSDDSGQGNKNRRREVIENANYRRRKVYQFDLSGNFMTEYASVREASRVLGINHSNITRVCNKIYIHTNGLIFSYDKDNDFTEITDPNAVKKKVVELNEYGEIINRWESIMDCSRSTGLDSGNISRACNDRRPHVKFRKFRFL